MFPMKTPKPPAPKKPAIDERVRSQHLAMAAALRKRKPAPKLPPEEQGEY